jgi:hypothetical protein
MSKINLVNFGCDVNYKLAKGRFYSQAVEIGWFDNIVTYSPDSDLLKDYNKSFGGRGAGYWWWKPSIILHELTKLEENDLLCYIDTGFYINKKGKEKFYQYINSVKDRYKLLAFKGNSSIEKHWTKRDLFILLNCDRQRYTNTEQICSGFMIFKKTHENIELLTAWQKVCMIDHAINDNQSFNENYPGFVEHRHDQSVFGLLVKKFYKNKDILILDQPDDPDMILDWLKNKKTLDGVDDILSENIPFYAARLNDYNYNQLIK